MLQCYPVPWCRQMCRLLKRSPWHKSPFNDVVMLVNSLIMAVDQRLFDSHTSPAVKRGRVRHSGESKSHAGVIAPSRALHAKAKLCISLCSCNRVAVFVKVGLLISVMVVNNKPV